MKKHQINWEKVREVIRYFIIMGITLIIASYVISLTIKESNKPENFERGYYEGLDDCKNNYQPTILLI